MSREAPTLATHRLTLRAPALRDRKRLIDLANNVDIARWLARLPHPYGEADADYFFDRVLSQETVWALTDSNDAFLGVISLMYSEETPHPLLGYWLGQPYWGAGLMGEAARAVMVYAFDTLGPPQIDSGHFVGNEASARLLQRLGFQETSRDETYCLALDRAMPHVNMTLKAGEFESVQTSK